MLAQRKKPRANEGDTTYNHRKIRDPGSLFTAGIDYN
jgi:hypothetical protein